MFKSKINPDELGLKTYEEYVAVFKKEVKKAQKFGRTNVIVLSHFKFACGTVSTMMVLGKISGPLAQWYKKIRRERGVEKDFAMGDCFFEPLDNGTTTLHIALNDGKGKPAQMTKNGKKLFKKLSFTPNIFKGELPEDLVGAGEGSFTDTELELIEQEADESNEDQSILRVYRQYTQALTLLNDQIVPRLRMPKEEAAWNPKHLDIARNAFVLSKSFLDKYEEVEEQQQNKFAEEKAKALDRQPMLQKIAAKIKTMFETKATLDSSVDLNTVTDKTEPLGEKSNITEGQQSSELETVVNGMKEQLEALNNFLDQLAQ